MVKIVIFIAILGVATVCLVYVAGKITGSLFEPSEKRIAHKKESPPEKPTSEKELERAEPYRKPVTGEPGKTEKPGGESAPESEQELPPVDPNSPAAPYLEAFKLMVEPKDGQWEVVLKVIDEGWNEEYPELVEFLKANREALLKLKAAIARGDCYFPIPEDSTGLEAAMRHLLLSRSIARLLALETRFLEKEGDIENAARNIADAMKFAQDVARKSTFYFSDRIGLDIEATFIEMVKKEVCKKSVNLDLCSALSGTFYEPDRTHQGRIEEMLDAEEPVVGRDIAYLRSNGREGIIALYAVDSSVADSCIDSNAVEKSANLYNQNYSELRSALQEGLFPALKKYAELHERAQEQAKSKELPECLISLVTPRFDIERQARVAADYEIARTGLGLELYAAENGKYPESLSELVPRYLSSVPVDPFSGEPIKYIRGEKGWTVYSFGVDMDDDKGEKERRRGSNDDDYDITLRKK